MAGVFLSYRRDDTAKDARRIHDRLASRFGSELVFLDVDDIPLGEDFVEHIDRALERAAYVLIAIGPRWLLVADEQGRRRLDDPEDLVRFEVRVALTGGKRVVPLLIGGANMPHVRELPPDIAALVRRNGIALRADPDFEADVGALMNGLHSDRIDTTRVPTVFRVGLVARSLGIGGALGWGAAGLIVGYLSGEDLAWALLAISGALAGLGGGAFVGWLTALLIRHRSPPLVPRKLVGMGLKWSLMLISSVAIAVLIGYFLGREMFEAPPTAAGGGIGEAIVATFVNALAAALVVVLITAMLVLVGLVTGSALAAAFFARQFRMRSDQISGRRAAVIAAVWLLGGLLTGVLLLVTFGMLMG